MTTIGDTGDTITSKRTAVKGESSVIETYEMPAAYESTFKAAQSIGQVSGTLKLAEYKSTVSGGKATVQLVYVTPAIFTGKYLGAGDPVKGSSTDGNEIAIELHPDYELTEAGVPYVGGTTAAFAKPGVEAYVSPRTTYTRETIETSFTWSESNIVSGVGACSSPSGLSGATSTKWLKVARDARTEGEVVKLTETWQYNPDGWDGDIYDGGA